MATLELTVSNQATGRVKVSESFELDDDAARLFIAQLETMLAGFEKPIRVVKTITPDGVTMIEIVTQPDSVPPVVRPSFEDRYRRALPPPQEDSPQ